MSDVCHPSHYTGSHQHSFSDLWYHIYVSLDLPHMCGITSGAVILTTLLYGSESWVTYQNHLKLLERFLQRCLRTILNIHWSNYITNILVLERADITSIEAMLLKIQLRWAGHGARMEDHRLPQDHFIWRTFFWPPKQRGAKEVL